MAKQELTADANGRLVRIAEYIRKANRASVEAFIEMCNQYEAAHKIHTECDAESGFSGWVKDNCNVSRKTAYQYLGVAKRFGSIELGLCWEPSALITLAGPNVPDNAWKSAVKRSKKGDMISNELAKELIESNTVESDDKTGACHPRVTPQTLKNATNEKKNEPENEPNQGEAGDENAAAPSVESAPTSPPQTDWKAIRKQIQQHVEYAQRGIDDLNRVRPYTDHEAAIEAVQTLWRIVEGWK